MMTNKPVATIVVLIGLMLSGCDDAPNSSSIMDIGTIEDVSYEVTTPSNYGVFIGDTVVAEVSGTNLTEENTVISWLIDGTEMATGVSYEVPSNAWQKEISLCVAIVGTSQHICHHLGVGLPMLGSE